MMILAHLRKRKDQEIVIKALENNQEIPFSLFISNRQRTYFNSAILFFAISIGIAIVGSFDIVPPVLAFIPFSISIGYFIIRYLSNSRTI